MGNISIADSIEPKENDHIKKDDNAAANEKRGNADYIVRKLDHSFSQNTYGKIEVYLFRAIYILAQHLRERHQLRRFH